MSCAGLPRAPVAAHPDAHPPPSRCRAALEGLRASETFFAAVEAVIELIYCTSHRGRPKDDMAPLVQLIVPEVMALKPRCAASPSSLPTAASLHAWPTSGPTLSLSGSLDGSWCCRSSVVAQAHAGQQQPAASGCACPAEQRWCSEHAPLRVVSAHPPAHPPARHGAGSMCACSRRWLSATAAAAPPRGTMTTARRRPRAWPACLRKLGRPTRGSSQRGGRRCGGGDRDQQLGFEAHHLGDAQGFLAGGMVPTRHRGLQSRGPCHACWLSARHAWLALGGTCTGPLGGLLSCCAQRAPAAWCAERCYCARACAPQSSECPPPRLACCPAGVQSQRARCLPAGQRAGGGASGRGLPPRRLHLLHVVQLLAPPCPRPHHRPAPRAAGCVATPAAGFLAPARGVALASMLEKIGWFVGNWREGFCGQCGPSSPQLPSPVTHL